MLNRHHMLDVEFNTAFKDLRVVFLPALKDRLGLELRDRDFLGVGLFVSNWDRIVAKPCEHLMHIEVLT